MAERGDTTGAAIGPDVDRLGMAGGWMDDGSCAIPSQSQAKGDERSGMTDELSVDELRTGSASQSLAVIRHQQRDNNRVRLSSRRYAGSSGWIGQVD